MVPSECDRNSADALSGGSRSRSLLIRRALRVTGPIDGAINLVVNLSIAWYFLRNAGPLPIWGLPSVFGFFGPMVACVSGCTVLSGYRNGVIWTPSRPPTRRSWLWPGVVLGLACAAIASLSLFAAMLAWDRAREGQAVAAWGVIITDGLVATVLGYCGQVVGVWAAVRRSSSM